MGLRLKAESSNMRRIPGALFLSLVVQLSVFNSQLFATEPPELIHYRASFENAVARVSAMRPFQRSLEGLRYLDDGACGDCISDEDAITAWAMRPFDDRTTFRLVQHARKDGTLELLKSTLQSVIDRQREGARGAEFERAELALLFYTGDQSEARTLGEKLAAQQLRGHAERDAIFLAILERIAGDDEAYARSIASCAPFSSAYRSNYGPTGGGNPCEQLAWGIAFRALYALEEKSPRAVQRIMVDSIAAHPNDVITRISSIAALQLADPNAASEQWEALHRRTDLDLGARLHVVEEQIGNAALRLDFEQAVRSTDEWLVLARAPDGGFDPLWWVELAAAPATPYCGVMCADDPVRAKLEARAVYAEELGHWLDAQRSLEEVMARVHGLDGFGTLRMPLLRLAAAELDARREEAERIIGYVAAQPLNSLEEKTLLDVLIAKLGRAPKTQSSPWSSPKREPTNSRGLKL